MCVPLVLLAMPPRNRIALPLRVKRTHDTKLERGSAAALSLFLPVRRRIKIKTTTRFWAENGATVKDENTEVNSQHKGLQ